ncbi:hypothetical protein GLP30_12340 [Photobacterium phosphoreum]|uniref:Uncharacterized protein n=2 Tax=Photobacterium phosphoreum TaxID=659 RepID=A0AAW5A1R5_PHOPO|nr:hypothetical protein [Photobacterium phosphoreum]MCD9462359.1 hypothetical protein [Photobacterium phosphoreum]MCD9471940.1 hypothetical protein [Photobacterium phosphoreum]MCD9477422.1 hypothetical protein [Photobacterium phosphoreum]MCD9482256.1 hypothetical protein [Photobacterium phosphoreum]MCD9491607.1 hypothetical protein [Photobacterium phosphoreum]
MSPADKKLLDQMMTLEGKDFTHLTVAEKAIFTAFKAREHDFGVSIDIATEAPIGDLGQGTSEYEINEEEKNYPREIIIKQD